MRVLERIYFETLARCRPENLLRVPDDAPRNVVAIGKCAAALFSAVRDVRDALVIVPEGYPRAEGVECLSGGHPEMTPASFAAGKRLIEFVEQHDDILFLISGGGSACVEWPLPEYTQEQLMRINHELIASGRPIGQINAKRKRYSAIKGGRLGARARGRVVTMVYSDVSSGALGDVASGPVLENMQLIADNSTLVRTAADLGVRQLAAAMDCAGLPARRRQAAAIQGCGKPQHSVIVWDKQIECDVAEAAEQLANAARELVPNQLLVAGGEPTVAVTGMGKGGRCCELAARFALHEVHGVEALFGSSDGVDGNSGAAGAILPASRAAIDAESIRSQLAASNSLAVVEILGRPIMIPPTGNNLRDLVLLARA